ncbi:MAG: S16 family serine protease [Candidatus Bathyarchaeia archaeon]
MISINDRRILSTVLILSLLINGVTIYELTIVFRRNNDLIIQVETLLKQNENLSAVVMNLKHEVENLRSQTEYYRAQAEYYSSLIEKMEANVSLIGRREINIVAVKTVSEGLFTVRYEGLTLKCIIELHVGSGRILVNTIPRIGIDLQTSVQTAASVAEKITGMLLSGTDIIVTVEAEEEVQVVDGPSAGAAITIAIISAIKGDELSNKVFITGTIMPDGSIGKVGGIAEKAEAAALKGGELFLLPKGQGIITVYKRIERYMPPFTVITWEPIQVSLQEYLSQKGYNMTVHEVSDVVEAYGYFARAS